ncbi:MAG TPA: dihydropteroate synthase [Pyrinomonadaceae bacterium]|nr:dihydropteroate synthase [Pyrinomonadaceae bacterium]
MREWHIRDRSLPIGQRTLVMGILNVTPDSFSDGGKFLSPDAALVQAEQMISEGADIIDIGGESTRPGAALVTAEEEMQRVLPVIRSLAQRTSVPISIDTTKSVVARAALDAGAAIVNDISALRFDFHIADEAAKVGAGLVLMHSRGTPATMQRLPQVADVLEEVTSSLRSSIAMAEKRGVKRESIVIDPGIGFGKTPEQNVELIAKLDQLAAAFPEFPILIGPSRKSFIGRLLETAKENAADSAAAAERGTAVAIERKASLAVSDRLHGTMASITAAILKGAHIVRVHDVKAAIETVRVADAFRTAARNQNSPDFRAAGLPKK